jgi:RNA polymerase sigma factor (TIGR02999 family)
LEITPHRCYNGTFDPLPERPAMSDVTHILSQIHDGDPSAAEQLLPLVYDELRKLAAQKMAQEKPGQTLQPTALVHEAFLRLVGENAPQQWNSRGHFFGAAAEAMRRILVDQARKKERVRHGGKFERVDLRDIVDARVPDAETVLAVNEAVTQLAKQEPEVAAIVKLHFFAGLTLDETAETLGVSRATVCRQWAYARACLRLAIQGEQSGTDG